MFNRFLTCGWILFACMLASQALLPVNAAEQTLWQIGSFDNSSGEFQGRLRDYSDASLDPVYTVGTSDPAKDWVALQPGSANGKAGFRAHPFTIMFDLPERPQGSYSLVVALLHYSPRRPVLEVEINGQRGWFYQRPKLNYDAGDTANVFLPNYSTDTITAELPAASLLKGSNKLVLTAIDDPAERDDAQAPIIIGNSAIIYDALKLVHDPAGRYQGRQVTAEVTPTIFYKSSPQGLTEVVEARVQFAQPCRNGRVVLTAGTAKLTENLSCDRDFGEARVNFDVPEFASSVKGQLEVRLNGRTSRFPIELTPAKKWTFFVVPNEHLDIGYSDYQAKVAEIQSRAIDEALEMIANYPEYRYTMDGYWCAEQFMRGRSKARVEKFKQAVADQKIFVPAQYASNVTGFATLEALIRSLYHTHAFARRVGAPFDFANITDVPSYSWSYASVMAAAGLKYFVAASDNYRAPVLLLGRLHEKTPFWWEGPDGGKILMWYSRHYHQVATLFGLPPSASAGRDSLPLFLDIYNRPDYKSDAVLIYGTQVENTDLFSGQAELVRDWSKLCAFPKMRYSGFSEAMEYISGQMGDSIPVIRGDGGPYWEDGIITNARITGLARENEHRVLAAEKVSTLTMLVDPALRPDRKTLNEIWENLLTFDEHTWTADRAERDPESLESIRQSAVKDATVTNAKLLIEHVLDRSLAALANYIPNPRGTLVVFNPLNWERSSLVVVDLDKGLDLVDLSTQQTVPFEVLSAGAIHRRIRFLASDVPALGYKCYAIRPATAEIPDNSLGALTTLESPYYRVTLAPESGAVKSIYDKQLGRELVDESSPYRFNQYVYVTGGDEEPNRLMNYNPLWPLPRLEPHGAANGRLVSVHKSPQGMVARLESSATNTPRIETEIILYDKQKKIEFINRVEKTKVYTKEGVYFAFPFALDHPRFRYASQNGFIDPAKDILPGGGLEWFSVQQWVAADQDGVTAAIVPVDAHLVTLGDIARGTWPNEFGDRQGSIFSYIMSNYWDTNWPAGQGGETRFRYVLTSGRDLTPGALNRLGWEEMSPLEANEIKPQDKAGEAQGPLPATHMSFLQVDRPGVVLLTWKLAQDEKGTILRFVEAAGESASVKVRMPHFRPDAAWLCNAMEENQQPLTISSDGFGFTVEPFQIVTVRLEGKPSLQLP